MKIKQSEISRGTFIISNKGIFLIIFLCVWLMFGQKTNAQELQTSVVPVVQDSYTSPYQQNDNYGSDKGVAISVQNKEDVCAFIQFDDTIVPDSSVIIDSAVFNFEVNYEQGDANPSIKIVPIDEKWSELGITWSNKPAYFFTDKYAFTQMFDTTTGQKQINLTDIARAWAEGSLENNGIIMCYDDKVSNAYFTFKARESGNPNLTVTYHYPDVALGVPVDDVVGQVDNDMNVAVLGEPIDNSASVGVISISDDIIELLTPKDKEILNTSSPVFRWKYLKALPKDLKPAISVKKDDGEIWEALLDEKDTSTTKDDGFSNGSYTWRMEVLDEDKVVQKTDKIHFVIDAPVQVNNVDSSANTNVQKPITDKTTTPVVVSKSVQKKVTTNDSAETPVKAEDSAKEAEETSQMLLWGILIGVSMALLILAIVLGIIWYKYNKDKKKSASEDTVKDENIADDKKKDVK